MHACGRAAPGVVCHTQSVRCLDVAEQALREAGESLDDVIRARVLLTGVTSWQEAARARGERSARVRLACTFAEVSRFIEPE